ncbi:MAG: PIG-L family deacetylase [Candidatus Latescibacterota bacterium]
MKQGHTDEKLTLLGIFAHPHDCVHALGTCGQHIKAGDSVVIVILTDGASTHNERLWEELQKPPEDQDPEIIHESPKAYAEQKAQEVRKACGYFGVTDVRILGYEDRPLQRTDELVEHLANLICEIRPEILIGELPESLREDRLWITPNDHTTCAALVHEAASTANHAKPHSKRIPHAIARTYYLATEKSYDAVDVYVDISDQYENRYQAEMCFLSQGHTPKFAKARMERSIGNYGLRAHVGYAETFVRGNMEVATHLLVTDRDLRMARGSIMRLFTEALPDQ